MHIKDRSQVYYLYVIVNKRILSIFIPWLALLTSMAQIQGVDTLFRAGDLIYFSELEQKSMQEFMDGNPDYLAMISAINPNADERELDLYRDWINGIVAEMKDKKIQQLNEPKKVERIKKYFSKGLLIRYEHQAGFDDLFKFGNYNYFTAAAMYAFVLEGLGIPYQIREMPTSIFLLAYPFDQKITIDITAPGYPYFMFDHMSRENFADFVYQQGVIGETEYRNTRKRDLFERYYFADYDLSIRGMIGMLYVNSALDRMMLNQSGDAYAQFEKAFLLHPSYRTQYLLLAELNSHLLEMDYHNPLDIGYLIKASRLINYGVKRDVMENFLEDIVYTLLVREEDEDGLTYIYEYLQKYIRDEDLRRNFAFRYFYEMGRINLSNARYQKALGYSESAFLIRPDDEPNQKLLVRSLGGFSALASPGLVLEKILHYDTAYSAILSDEIYLMVKSEVYLRGFGEAFQLQDGPAGVEYMAQFEKLMAANPDTGIDHLLVGRSYSSAAIYYYRKGMVSKSRQVIERGLSYAPDNIELKLKLTSFE